MSPFSMKGCSKPARNFDSAMNPDTHSPAAPNSQMAMNNPPSDNVVPLDSKGKDKVSSRDLPRQPESRAGGQDDPRLQEALKLVQAFLAIEDPVARGALVTLAEQMVSYEWARRAHGR